LVPKDQQWEMAYGELNGHVMMSRDSKRSNLWPPIRL